MSTVIKYEVRRYGPNARRNITTFTTYTKASSFAKAAMQEDRSFAGMYNRAEIHCIVDTLNRTIHRETRVDTNTRPRP